MSKFSFNTINNFEDHINKSIPHYSVLYDIILSISSYFIKQNTYVYDIGCSTGKLIHNLSTNNIKDVTYVGVDISENLLPSLKHDNLHFLNSDIRNENFYLNDSSLILSIFTLQFIEPKFRLNILKNIYNSLLPKGAFILCEKTYSNDGLLQDIFTFSHYELKLEHFTSEEILSKQKDLRNIMTPYTSIENLNLLKESGFSKIDPFYQSLHFKGWICRK